MAHFAKLDSTGTVVTVVNGRDEDSGSELELFNRTGETYRQTYTDGTRKKFAAIGDRYDVDRDAFIPPRPFPSWTLNETTCRWGAPVAKPESGFHRWDEATTSWVEIPNPKQEEG